MSESEHPITVTEQTAVSLKLLVGVVGSVFGAALWIQASLTDIKYRLAAIESKQEAADQASRQNYAQYWLRSDMAHFAELLKLHNPELEMPKVNE